MTIQDPRQIALDWLADFSDALAESNTDTLTDLFLPHGWLRDCLVLTWNTRSLEGHERIKHYLDAHLSNAKFDSKSVQLDEQPELAPKTFTLSKDIEGIEAAFVFETALFHGRGFVRLQIDNAKLQCVDGSELEGAGKSGRWKALSVYLAVDDIRGHEEAGYESGIYGEHTLAWSEVISERRAEIEKDPQVLVIGAGQTGLQVAARFQQMNIRTIVIERNERVGDNWRKRYPTLSLNTPRTHHCLLYASYPRTWPIYTPRDKVASWLEHYAESQDLVVWTSTYPLPGPTYDGNTRRWRVTLSKDGSPLTLHPTHIILATGTLGDPFTPRIPALQSFRGVNLHASAYAGGEAFSGKRVLIVGAGTTAADIAQDLCFRGAESVTMFQRQPTCVVSRKLADQEFQAWPEGVPVEVSDFRVAATTLGLLARIARSASEQTRRAEIDKDLREGLEKSGFKTSDGPNGGGRRELVYDRLGGYWIDVGAAALIIDGRIAIKSGVEITQFNENGTGVSFSDGSVLDTDAVIFATGYENIRPSMRKLFGANNIDRTSEVWGLDEEGELKGCYRPSGHPGLWYAAGDFYHSRYMSKQLALLIKAEELGLSTNGIDSVASVPIGEPFPASD